MENILKNFNNKSILIVTDIEVGESFINNRNITKEQLNTYANAGLDVYLNENKETISDIRKTFCSLPDAIMYVQGNEKEIKKNEDELRKFNKERIQTVIGAGIRIKGK